MIINGLKNISKYIAFVIFGTLFFILIMFVLSNSVYAITLDNIYTDVLTDLRQDESFDSSLYVLDESDYSLNVIQVAESTDKELFIYVYQPSGSDDSNIVEATTIRFSTGINDNIKFHDYKLLLINNNGVFFKYKVLDFTVLPDALRYYSVSAIHRLYDEDIDDGSTSESVITEVDYSVGKLWTASTVNNVVFYSMTYEEVIEITDKYVDFLRYSDGLNWIQEKTDSHYIAFNTDKQIDKLMEADLEFYTLPIPNGGNPSYNFITLLGEDKGYSEANGLFAHKYEWYRIESVSNFIANEDLTEETLDSLDGKKWVLRFYESKYEHYHNSLANISYTKYTSVTDVTILRLKFVTDGVVYNLGAVDNKMSADSIPGNNNQNELDLSFVEDFQKMFMAIMLIILCIVLLPVLIPLITHVIIPLIKYFIKAIWFVITLPFRIIKSVFRKD